MQLVFVSVAVNLFYGINGNTGLLKKKQHPQQKTSKRMPVVEFPQKLNFNASNIHVLKKSIHKAESDALLFDCYHQLVLTNV